MKKIKSIQTTLATLLLIGMLYACAKVPMTGRRQIKLFPSSTMLEMSTLSYKQVLDTASIIRSGQQAEMVKRVGNKIATATERYLKENGFEDRLDDFSWEFNLIQDNSVNAWCMSGGKVAFYTGILPVCEDETGIAVVMGPEVAHAIAWQGNERVSQSMTLQGLATDTDLFMLIKQQPDAARQLANTAFGVGGQ